MKGIKYVVFSPGSRNAPFVLSFSKDEAFETLVIPDERVAGFFALGIAQQTHQPVAVVCTSGSAVVNYFPAITEAFYQRLPLVVMSADRPEAFIDQGEGQSIRQKHVFGSMIRSTCSLREGNSEEIMWYNNRIINETLNAATYPNPGPVHINVPLSEPLYQPLQPAHHVRNIKVTEPLQLLDTGTRQELYKEWQSKDKKLILTGVLNNGPELNDVLKEVATDPSVVVLTEYTSNLNAYLYCQATDRIITTFNEADKIAFRPDVVLTIGHSIISKKIKHLIREWGPEHWHITDAPEAPDTFKTLSRFINVTPSEFLKDIASYRNDQSTFHQLWKERDLLAKQFHEECMPAAPFSDLKAYWLLHDYIPDFTNVQMGNSAAVRYLQLCNQISTLIYSGNRGVSGIDGSVSTAAGAAWINEREGVNTMLICGDMSFVYDSNALWHNHLSPALRIAVVNNAGGGIFRIIDGPSGTDQLEKFFDAHVDVSIEHLCKAFNLNYYRAENEDELHEVMPSFLFPQENDRPALLEVITPRDDNASILKDYFTTIKRKTHDKA